MIEEVTRKRVSILSASLIRMYVFTGVFDVYNYVFSVSEWWFNSFTHYIYINKRMNVYLSVCLCVCIHAYMHACMYNLEVLG